MALRVFNIPTGVPFLEALAEGLLARFPDPLELAAALVLLPTRRACRGLAEAFLRASGGRPLLLPRLLPLGELDSEEILLGLEDSLPLSGASAELPPAIGPLARQLLLARAILAWSHAAGPPATPSGGPAEEQAVRLAQSLGHLIDQVETEGLSFSGLDRLAPESFADHWQETLRFLGIVTEHWPRLAAELGGIGPAELRRRLAEVQAEIWRTRPPATPVIAAGSTGSIPSTAALLKVVAALPRGEVVLPGLDRSADPETWTAVAEDPCHPQHGLARLLAVMEVEREAVADWPTPVREGPGREGPGRLPPQLADRAELLNAALAPAETTARWQELAEDFPPERVEAAFAGLRRADCPGAGEEAIAVALLLREALETPGRRAALVTPDRGLARRVAAELRRWDVEIDDSAGQPLADTPAGQFLRLTAAMLESELSPVPLLACLKHPLAAAGEAPHAFRSKVRRLEVAALRGPRPAPGFAGLSAALAGTEESLHLGPWLERLEAEAARFRRALAGAEGLAAIVDAHIAFVERLAASEDESGAERLWRGEDGEAAALFLAELREANGAASGAAETLGRLAYPALLEGLMAGRVVRPRFGRHPRLAILGPLEARLASADLLVLGGLNEGVWPVETDPGPWMSRPMRTAFGLPPVERRIGLAAHDFLQACGAREVVITRAARLEGSPAVPSRWLLRLDALLEALNARGVIRDDSARIAAWGEALDRAEALRPLPPPAPKPPRAARPKQLSVTEIETLMRDPYAVYARRVLKLKPLDPLDADPSAADRGIIVHRVLERFVARFPEALPEDPHAELLRIGHEVFEESEVRPGVRAFWEPRFARLAAWVAAEERRRREGGIRVHAEAKGSLLLAGGFRLTAKADRIEVAPDGRLALLDYKTGLAPSTGEVAAGLAPQLPLEGAIAEAGGFSGVAAAPVKELLYWRLSGGRIAGEAKTAGGDAPSGTLIAEALAGLERLLAAFADPETPYHAVPRPDRAPRFSDYAHLARLKEWSAGGPEEAP